jgi:hypothetical protein
MIQSAAGYRTKSAVPMAVQPSADVAFPLACLALAFGVIAGVAIAGIVVPVVVQTVVPAVMRAIAGA